MTEKRRREPLPSETLAGQFLDQLTGMIGEEKEKTSGDFDEEGVEKSASPEVLRRLVEDVRKAMFRYVESRIEFVAANRQYRSTKDKGSLEMADRARRSAHKALVDSIMVATRNVVKASRKKIPSEFESLIGSSEDPAVREAVAQATIDYTLACLEHET